KAALFQTAQKVSRDEPGVQKDPIDLPPTQIGRALQELQIAWIPAHSPQAKGRVERGFSTAQDRLVKGLRVAGISCLDEANAYLEEQFLPWWNRTLTVAAKNHSDAHRPLTREHDLASSLSHVEERQISNGYTVQYHGTTYQIRRARCARECAVPSCASKHGWTEPLPCALATNIWASKSVNHRNR